MNEEQFVILAILLIFISGTTGLFAGLVVADYDVDITKEKEVSVGEPEVVKSNKTTLHSEPRAELYTVGQNSTVVVEINRMPPDIEYQGYLLWQGCDGSTEFKEPGVYVVDVEETNVKLVDGGDYTLYGYHDFAPNQTDQCQPDSVHKGDNSVKLAGDSP